MKNVSNKSKAYYVQKQMRKSWGINPVTRIKEDERRNMKKRRQDIKNEIKRFKTDEPD